MYYHGPGYIYVTPDNNVGISLSRYSIPQGSQILTAINVPSENYYRTMEARFHIFDGCGLQHYRMVYESGFVSMLSPMGFDEVMYRNIYNNVYANSLGLPKVNVTPTGYVKMFEYVKGARITGKAPAGVNEVVITAGSVTRTVSITDEDVENGSVITVDLV
jgi:dolichyl-diphosphooligosaccharide--protein glycosyltransferase